GLDGAATCQFGAVAERVARPFDLDLVIVNMLRNDVIRRPRYRGRAPASVTADVTAYVRERIMTRVNWFEPYPEVLAVIAGAQLGLAPRLVMPALEDSKESYYATVDEAVAVSAPSIGAILKHFPSAIFLADNTYHELKGTPRTDPRTQLEDAAFRALADRFP